MFTIYLAGDLRSWRDAIKKEFSKYNNIKFIDPIELETQNALGKYIADELSLIKQSDIVFAYIAKDSPSEYFGTTAEIMFAFCNNIPVLLIDEKEVIHPFHAYVSKYIRTNMYSGIKALKGLIESGNEFLVDYIK